MKNKKTLVLIVGETGAGKDTVANMLPFPKVVSYKTGPLRDTDIEGVTHYFISDEEMDELEKRDDLIAWTKTGNIRYCATASQLKDDITIYIINPDGVRWFKEHYKKDDLNIVVIGIYLDLETRRARCRLRSDFDTVFMNRVMAEQNDYDIFRLDGEFDYMIKNKDSNKTAAVICDIINNEEEIKNYYAKINKGIRENLPELLDGHNDIERQIIADCPTASLVPLPNKSSNPLVSYPKSDPDGYINFNDMTHINVENISMEINKKLNNKLNKKLNNR